MIEDLFGCVQHRDDRLFVHFLAGHVDRCQMHVCIFTSDGAPRSSARHEQDVGVATIAADMSADHPVGATPVPQNSSASAVAEEHTAVAIGPVRDGR